MENAHFRNYAKISKEIEELEDKRDKLKAQIIVNIVDLKRVKNRYGLFTVVERKSYAYSDDVTPYAEKYEEAKNLLAFHKEQDIKNGKAQHWDTNFSLRHQA